MQGLKVGHVSHDEHGTGITVFLLDQPARGAYLLCGSGPATHELAPLDPETSVNAVHALVFSGGSAFGLYAAEGVMRYLAERNIGLTLPHGVVPIVPAAAIYDLIYKKAEAPTAKQAYEACRIATEDNNQSGQIGAGRGATVGKIVPQTSRMTSGIGRKELMLPNGIAVTAYVVVNAIGDVIDAQNNIMAGAKNADGSFANCTQFLLQGGGEEMIFSHSNTTLAAIFTNAKFNKSELKRIAKMAISGMSRAISPVFTCYDGDILFAISLGEKEASVLTVGTLAAEAVRLAILDAVKQSKVVA